MELAEELQEELVHKIVTATATANGSADHDMDDVRHSIEDDPFFVHDEQNWSNGPACQGLLLASLWPGGRGGRLWDFLHLLPQLVFLVFLLWRRRHTRQKVEGNHALETLHWLIGSVALAAAIRAIVNLVLFSFLSNVLISLFDRLGWTLLRTICLLAEMTAPALATLPAMLDNRRLSRLGYAATAVSLLFWVVLVYQDIV
jgi:hypothetical protein